MKINTIEKLLAMLLLQVANLPTYITQVGATEREIMEIEQDAANIQALMDYAALIDANKKTVIKIKQHLFNGDPDEPISPFPKFEDFTPPFALAAGALERASERNRRYKAAAGYTKEIGIALGIDGDANPVSPGDVKPTFEAHPAQTGYHAALVISNRGEAKMWKAFGQTAMGAKQQLLGSGEGKGGSIEIEPSEAGKPERMLVTIQLYKNNEPYGQPSDPQYVTFNP
jgi:hypothetical protein